MSSKEILRTARKNTTFFLRRPRTDFGGFDPVRPLFWLFSVFFAVPEV